MKAHDKHTIKKALTDLALSTQQGTCSFRKLDDTTQITAFYYRRLFRKLPFRFKMSTYLRQGMEVIWIGK